MASTHTTTLEITMDTELTAKGDCIIAVGATCGPKQLPPNIKEVLASDDGRATLLIRVGDERFKVKGRGSKGLSFEHAKEMVFRKSGFVSDRTVMVHADKAAIDIPRKMVRLLQSPEQLVTIEITAIP